MIIALRDFRAFFTTPVAYILSAGFLGIMGFFFFYLLDVYNIQNLQYSQMQMGGKVTLSQLIQGLFQTITFIFLLVVTPVITMRLFAEEKKMHTIELLMTAPITLTQLVLGKFLSAMLFVFSLLGMTLIYPIILLSVGSPDLGLIFTCYIGNILMVASFVSIGVMFSALTDNQIIAFFLTFVTCFLLWLIGVAAVSVSATVGDILKYVSVLEQYQSSFLIGTLNLTAVIYYLSLTTFFLFVTQRVLDSYRWR